MPAFDEIDPEQRKEYWLCRRANGGHKWDDTVNIAYAGKVPDQRTWEHHVSKRCTRCLTVCHEWLDVFGDIERRVYVYPPGYEYRGEGEEAPTSGQQRLWRLQNKDRRR